jgi:hypothetical protein
MEDQVNLVCDNHESAFDCPDALVSYSSKFREYGLIVHDGGGSSILIEFCPWCGVKLPKSLRDRWFDELESQGFESPFEDPIPDKYKTEEWYSQ